MLIEVEVNYVIMEICTLSYKPTRCKLGGDCFSMCPQDDEITVEKYISPEERKRMEETEKQEEQRRLAEMVGNSFMPC